MQASGMTVARGSGKPGNLPPRRWPVMWRSWVMSSPSRRRRWRKWEKALRASNQAPRALDSFRYLLSYPRSGNHLIRYIIESISGYPTWGAREGFLPQHTGLWVDTPIYVKTPMRIVSRRAIVIKRHVMEPTDQRSAPLVVLVRNPTRAMVSHVGLEFAWDNVAAVANEFIALCHTVDAWPSPTSLHWYEDFTTHDVDVFRAATSRLLDAVGVDAYADQLENFVSHRERHVRRAFHSLERPTTSSSIDWNGSRVQSLTSELWKQLSAASGSSPTLCDVLERYSSDTRPKSKERQN